MGCATKCTLVTARILIALACLPAAVPYTLGLKTYCQYLNLKSPTEAMSLAEFVLSYFISFIATIGIFVALLGNRGSIRCLGLVLTTMMFLVAGPALSKQSASDDMVSISTKMSNLMPFYTWDERNGSIGASAVIDEIQRSRCCGILGPNDWWILRPAHLNDSIYPSSCCDLTPDTSSIEEVNSITCNAKQMNRIGCLDYYYLARQAEIAVKAALSFDLFIIAIASMIYWAFFNQYDAIDSMCYS